MFREAFSYSNQTRPKTTVTIEPGAFSNLKQVDRAKTCRKPSLGANEALKKEPQRHNGSEENSTEASRLLDPCQSDHIYRLLPELQTSAKAPLPVQNIECKYPRITMFARHDSVWLWPTANGQFVA